MNTGGLFDQFPAWVSALLLAVAMFCAWVLGWWIGRRRPGDVGAGEPPGEKFSDASFALLGLLLAFAFGMSLQKHASRRDMVINESNAIGDYYTCVTLLPDPMRGRLQSLVRDFAELHLTAVRERADTAAVQQLLARADEQVAQMTELTREAVAAGTPIAVPLTNTLNEITSAKAARIFAIEDRLPTEVVAVLFANALASMVLAGRRHAALGRAPPWLGVLCTVVLVTLVVYVILDLNQPGRGLVQVSQAPMQRLVNSMKP